MSQLDNSIQSDLGALADASDCGMPEFAAFSAQLVEPREAYRDDLPGAEARRRSLLENRLRELALMPVAYERVFVHRVSRAAAGAVMLASVWCMILASLDDSTQSLFHIVFGRPTAPLVVALLGGATLLGYVIGGLFAERHYERHMRGRLRDGADPFSEIERLEALVATDRGQRLVNRVDGLSVALAMAGTVAGGVVLGLMVFFSDPGYSAFALVQDSLNGIIPAVFAGSVSGLVIGRACTRDRRAVDGSGLVRLAQGWGCVAVCGVLAVVSLWNVARTALNLHMFSILPSHGHGLLLSGLGSATLICGSAWLLLRLRRKEARMLGAADGDEPS